jgi:hypothetical protein
MELFKMKLSILALAAVLGAVSFSAVPAFAAFTPGDVPFCSSNTAQKELGNGTYAQELARPGETLQSVDIWNGCVKAVYTDAHGHSTTAFYDPDSLQLIDTMRNG